MKFNVLIVFFVLFSVGSQAQFFQFDELSGVRHADIVAVDIDNDGDLDIIVSGEAIENNITVSKSIIYINENGTYINQSLLNKATYQNPVFTPDLADPSVIKAPDGWFYAYGTENTWPNGRHRIVPIIKSKDMVKWEYVSDAFFSRPKWKSSGGIWAPDVTYVNDKYYMYYSFSTWGDPNPGIGLAIANQPYGPFVDQGKLFDSNSIGVANSIDPAFIQTGIGRNQKSYLFWGSFNGIYGIELGADLKSLVGDKFKITNNMFEAVYIMERNGKFYFFGSLGSCCDGANSKYRVAVARATNIKGPYLNKAGNSILNEGNQGTLLVRGEASLGWVGPGHNAQVITDDAGNDFLFYHAVQVAEPNLPNGATRRPLMLDKIYWNNEWPEITGAVPSVTLQLSPVIKP